MRVPCLEASRQLRFNMTPMIDVVFLLIIFFLVSSHLAQQESQLELDLPQAVTQQAAEETTARVTIHIRPSGEVLLGAQRVESSELAKRLEVEAKRRGSDLEVRLRGDRRAKFGDVAPVLWSCAQAGLWNVRFAVLERQE